MKRRRIDVFYGVYKAATAASAKEGCDPSPSGIKNVGDWGLI